MLKWKRHTSLSNEPACELHQRRRRSLCLPSNSEWEVESGVGGGGGGGLSMLLISLLKMRSAFQFKEEKMYEI